MKIHCNAWCRMTPMLGPMTGLISMLGAITVTGGIPGGTPRVTLRAGMTSVVAPIEMQLLCS